MCSGDSRHGAGDAGILLCGLGERGPALGRDPAGDEHLHESCQPHPTCTGELWPDPAAASGTEAGGGASDGAGPGAWAGGNARARGSGLGAWLTRDGAARRLLALRGDPVCRSRCLIQLQWIRGWKLQEAAAKRGRFAPRRFGPVRCGVGLAPAKDSSVYGAVCGCRVWG